MTLRKGIYVVPTDRWYIERTVWLIAGLVLLASTALAVWVNPLWIFGVIATGLVSINVAFTGFCPIGNVLKLIGFKPALGAPNSGRFYFLQTDSWYLERRIYVTVGVNITLGSILFLAAQSVVGPVHRIRWRRHGLVRRHRPLHPGQRAVLDRRRAAAQSGRAARGYRRRPRRAHLTH